MTASFITAKNDYTDILITEGLSLIGSSALMDDLTSKFDLSKLFEYVIRRYKIDDIVTMEVFRKCGTKNSINNHPVYYIGSVDKLFELKKEM